MMILAPRKAKKMYLSLREIILMGKKYHGESPLESHPSFDVNLDAGLVTGCPSRFSCFYFISGIRMLMYCHNNNNNNNNNNSKTKRCTRLLFFSVLPIIIVLPTCVYAPAFLYLFFDTN